MTAKKISVSSSANRYGGLPDKLWQMLSLALDDLAAVEKMKDKYVVRMDIWYMHGYVNEAVRVANRPDSFEKYDDFMAKPTEICGICFAGAVMACTLGDGPDDLQPEDFPEFIKCKLKACDMARGGGMETTLNTFYGNWDWDPDSSKTRKLKNVVVPAYDRDRAGFKRGINTMIKQLKAVDL
jgi:hypothetical protein